MSAASLSLVTNVCRERSTCRVCEGSSLERVLDLGTHYLAGFVRERSDRLPKAPLDLVVCSDCGLVQLRHTVTPDLLWREYWYRSGINQTMRDALQDVVKDGLTYHERGTWLDIGANDGTLLSLVPAGFLKVGFEPAKNLLPWLTEHANLVVGDYFHTVDDLRGACQVITSCAMFYDLDDPNAIVADIVASLADNGVWINQLSHTPDMLAANAFDNICFEHVCYYDIEALHALYRRHGLFITSVKLNDLNGGSIRVAATKKRTDACSLGGVPRTRRDDLSAFAGRVVRWKALMERLLTSDLVARGDIWLYGASTKASTFLQYLDLPGLFIAAAERNPAKHGLVTAGTWIPIRSEEEFREAAPAFALVGPWAFAREVTEREKDLRAHGTAFIFPLPDPRFVL